MKEVVMTLTEPNRPMDAAPLDHETVDAFRARLRGPFLQRGDPDYDAARQVWNAMVDRRPALITRCAGAADVVTAVRFAREQGLAISVKGGGHSVAGKAVCDDGLMIDLTRMDGIRVDPVRRTARAEGGVTWGAFDRETQAFGLATTGGIVPTTGVGGLTLGGGLGYLMRRFGLACDNLLSADVVTADGQLLTASQDEHSDLFWGLRGGGGNFGVVTSFEYELHPVGPTVLGGFVFHPFAQAREVARFYREFTAAAPDELTTYLAFATSPDGDPVAAFIVCYSGSVETGETVIKPLRDFGSPLADTISPLPYTEVQAFGAPLYPPGRLNYWKSNFLDDLSDEAIAVLIAQFAAVPSPLSAVAIEHLGGAVARVDSEATAFGDRSAPYSVVITGEWVDTVESVRNVQWVRDCWQALQPYVKETVYINYLDAGDDARVQSAYRPQTYQRLAALKQQYDPDNVFRLNPNIPPSAASAS
jgi:FAD/FMN-containing dehydrogenase